MRRPSGFIVLAVAMASFAMAPIKALGAEDDIVAAQGRALYLDFQCWQCHGYEGQGGAAPRIASINYAFEAFERFVRFPNVMPAYPPDLLDDDSLRRVYAFVRSLPEPPRREDIPALNAE